MVSYDVDEHKEDMGASGTAVHKVEDPVCGMDVDPAKTPLHADNEGLTYHFCSAGGRTKSIASPNS